MADVTLSLPDLRGQVLAREHKRRVLLATYLAGAMIGQGWGEYDATHCAVRMVSDICKKTWEQLSPTENET